ncbi:MAG: HAD family hydrolase [Puniceicoccales bacterium]|jgi:putative hydrolase of the HAD superfamily|nr:HAD family hydrolase [Puniceicoccales bacterium]
MPLAKAISSLLHPIETKISPIKPKLKKIPDIRAVIFDVYGTLFTTNVGGNSLFAPNIESDKLIVEAFEESDFDVFAHDISLSELYEGHIKAHYDIRRSEGITYPEINICDVWQDFLNELFAIGIIDGDLTERSIRRVIVCHECKVNPTWPAKGSLDFIRTLQDNNVIAGTISTAQFYTPIIMETLYQNSLKTLGFEAPICIWSYEHRHRKPSAVLFKLCEEGLKVFGIKPSQTLCVGNDMFNDIVPATKAGFKTALFTGDIRSIRLHEDIEECAKEKPTIVFNEFGQLGNCIL